MKKLLPLVLVLAMVLGLTVPAFALGTYAEEVIFTLNEYVNDSTPVTVNSVSVKPESLPNPVTKFRWFYCISGDSSYVNYCDDETGWQKMEFDQTECEQKLSEGTPDLNNCAMFAVISIKIGNDTDYVFDNSCTVKYGSRVIPNISTYIDPDNYTEQEQDKFALDRLSFLYIPTDEYWTWQENEITAFVKLFDTTSGSGSNSGTTDITAIKAAPLSYELVIPQSVPTITAAGVTEIGAPSVKDVKNATEKTVISYTASGTQLTLENSDKTMKTSYYTDSEGKTDLTDDAIKVYKNSAVIASPTTLYVGVTETDWNAADAGTYHATVTFNFSAKEAEAKTVTAADALATDAQYNLKFESNYVVGLLITPLPISKRVVDFRL